MGRLIIDGNRVYELDEACLQRRKRTGNTPEGRDMQTVEKREKQMKKRVKT